MDRQLDGEIFRQGIQRPIERGVRRREELTRQNRIIIASLPRFLPRLKIVAGVLVCLIAWGCSQKPKGQPIAKVGSATLTMEEAKAAIDTTQGPFELQLENYVSLWVNNQLLYQEAQRVGIEEDEAYRRDLEDAHERLAIHALLQKQIYSDTSALNESNLRDYFAKHKGEFFTTESMVKLNVIGFTDRQPASEFAAKVSRNTPWVDALRAVRTDSSLSSSMVSSAVAQFYSQATLIPVELWRVAQTLSAGEISFPVKTNLGYFIIQLMESVPAGKQAEFEIARDEVRNRALIERRRSAYEQYIGTLRKQYNVDIMVNSPARADSGQNAIHQ